MFSFKAKFWQRNLTALYRNLLTVKTNICSLSEAAIHMGHSVVLPPCFKPPGLGV